MGALFLHLKPDEYLKKLYKTKKLVEKTSFSLQAEGSRLCGCLFDLRIFSFPLCEMLLKPIFLI
ncbi:hypothetical protein D9C10_12175 [Bacillus subtilis subsp. subtilis]|uniref:hypothetical protein n=1 Tax=Bacillus subtilis TaxID=1423 RepID=UPI000EF1BB0F|nr:hypothetical protein [Bacillus subtilis]AYK57859.1 hypothetical protein D9C10_12175 [Bacillus subtilis subsp. subtilis]